MRVAKFSQINGDNDYGSHYAMINLYVLIVGVN